MMELLMTDMISALSGGHWGLVEETLGEWAPTAPLEAAELGEWPVYRGWSAVWHEAATGQRPAAELYEPVRAKIASSFHELGSAVASLPVLTAGKNPHRDADLLCSARYRAQNMLLDAMRKRGEEAARAGDLLRDGGLIGTAVKLRRHSKHEDLETLAGDLAARSKSLVAASRAARGNPAPLSVDDITSNFAGWIGLHVAEEGLWFALTDIAKDADIRPLGDSAHRKELSDLRDRIAAGRKANAEWTAWLAGSGPTDVIKFLMLAQSQMK